MGKLKNLYEDYGQSPWLDNLRRDWIESGELDKWVEKGCRGITSNPTIFANAINSTSAYDGAIKKLNPETKIDEAYWDIVTADITAALETLLPIYESSEGSDGYVSLEISPKLAEDTESTIKAAVDLHSQINAPNLLIKVPATAPGVDAIRELTAEGVNINATLIFSLDRYRQVIEAYMDGLEKREGNLRGTFGVASFFVSRVDTQVDRMLDELENEASAELKGKAAIAQAVTAYQIFLDCFSGIRWKNLESRGAGLQKPLWASTSTKNPDYPDTLYADSLIGPNTVNTLPDATLGAFDDHGTLARTLDSSPDEARTHLERIGAAGINMGKVSEQLENEGVSAFVKSFDEVVESLKMRIAE